ncbi:L-aspartate oxidase [Gracilibacillus halophilus YIM-C55.5]|uniref:L-aspartate oxidase n=1 Tax=Gracilibacillus halophilus YIM-C55.5 TaxID=1308866 RepID=N4WKC3_9BACI|nr:L-aspartate oxidase [Gracilibacillus halophilus]ENH96587.1 L-aspartate oxidase [Gracilibacillus halophilus YIM-C55.5]
MARAHILIVGAGLAALAVADQLKDQYDVTVMTKGTIDQNNSNRAQGGIAAAIDSKDSWKQHYNDTLEAGCFFNHKRAVEKMTYVAKHHVLQLLTEGFPADRNEDGHLDLTAEGAHRYRRIVHAGGDQTGAYFMKFYQQKIKDNVRILTHHTAVSCIMENNHCCGIYALDEQDQMYGYYADAVVLATGGVGGLYQHTSNDWTVTGDGLAIAYRAGAKLTDLEFIQFHPTLLHTSYQAEHRLVSEAVRGEGGILVNQYQERFMEDVHPDRDLAPRDEVARAIDHQMKQGNEVFLDISHIEDFDQRFPTIASICELSNIDWRNGYIPVIPGAHFLMGGIHTDLTGKTSVSGLYAVGEVACTGVHGANRLASNSLLEAIVFAEEVAKELQREIRPSTRKKMVRSMPQTTGISLQLPDLEELRQHMHNYVGVVRDEEGLRYMQSWLDAFPSIDHSLYTKGLTRQQIESIHQLTVARLLTTAALLREESIGAHFRRDALKQSKIKAERHPIYIQQSVLNERGVMY